MYWLVCLMVDFVGVDNMPSFLYLLVKGLRRLTNVSSRRANVQKTWFGDVSILWYKFLGTALLQLHNSGI